MSVQCDVKEPILKGASATLRIGSLVLSPNIKFAGSKGEIILVE